MPNEPFPLAAHSRLGISLIPSETLRAGSIGLNNVPGGKAQPGGRILLRFVADAQLDRVHAKFRGQLVDSGLETKGPDRLTRRTHERVGEHVQGRDPHLELETCLPHRRSALAG